MPPHQSEVRAPDNYGHAARVSVARAWSGVYDLAVQAVIISSCVPVPTHSQGAAALLEATISEASQEQQTPNSHLRKSVPPQAPAPKQDFRLDQAFRIPSS